MSEQKKIALFVDFDNIYLGLRETSREAAEAFATRPHVWLKWIEHGMPLERRGEPNGPRENRVLIRQCYLNPDTFGKYRGYFTRSGFSVVDCPPLTSRGKNSSDIVMVMDILDALRHETHFDRFVIMSADADFTPVLQRLRAHDRRTAVLVSGQAAPAYRAACDRLITEDAFIELALEITPSPEPQRAPAPPQHAAPSAVAALRDPELLSAMGRRIYEEASSSGTLSASELPRILREFKEFTPTSNWLGYYSLQGLTEAILAHRNDLRITDDDPWRIAVHAPDEAAARTNGRGPDTPPAPEPGAEGNAVRDRVVELVARLVAESPEPVVMGKAAHAAIQEAGPMITETRWLGHGTFKNLLLSAPELPFRVVAFPLPGFLYDPARHVSPAERAAAADGLAELDGEMVSLIRRIHQLTDAPKLTPRQYGVLFRVIAKELDRAPYNLMSTGKAVRDQCVERGEPIARQSITTVLRGLGYAGYRLWDPPHRAENLAQTYRGNLLNLLRQAQVTLNDDELRMLDDWLVGTSRERDAGPPPAPPSAHADVRTGSPDGDAGRAPEPDYAAWADALLASGPREPVSTEPPREAKAVADVAPGPFAWPPPDALPLEEHPRQPRDGEPGSADSMDAVPSSPAEPPAPSPYDAFAWPPSDALQGNPADGPMSPSDAAPPIHAQPGDEPTTADEQPSSVPPRHTSADGTAGPSQPAAADDVSAAADDPDADAFPVELSADPGPRGPDVVAADWELSHEPSAAGAAGPDSALPHPALSRPDAPEPASPPNAPADVFMPYWEPADAPTGEQPNGEQPAPAAGTHPASDVVTPQWEPVDPPGSAPAEPRPGDAPHPPSP